jgi:CheY-like chemotaxis protein
MLQRPVVLVIDDNEDSRVILRTVLEHAGFAVLESADPRMGVTAAQQAAPSLIIVELMMRRLSGYETLVLLRLDARLQGVPVLAASAREHEAPALAAGFQGFLSKPFVIPQLIEQVRRYGMPIDA